GITPRTLTARTTVFSGGRYGDQGTSWPLGSTSTSEASKRSMQKSPSTVVMPPGHGVCERAGRASESIEPAAATRAMHTAAVRFVIAPPCIADQDNHRDVANLRVTENPQSTRQQPVPVDW